MRARAPLVGTQVTDSNTNVTVSVRQHLSTAMKLDCVQAFRVPH